MRKTWLVSFICFIDSPTPSNRFALTIRHAIWMLADRRTFSDISISKRWFIHWHQSSFDGDALTAIRWCKSLVAWKRIPFLRVVLNGIHLAVKGHHQAMYKGYDDRVYVSHREAISSRATMLLNSTEGALNGNRPNEGEIGCANGIDIQNDGRFRN